MKNAFRLCENPPSLNYLRGSHSLGVQRPRIVHSRGQKETKAQSKHTVTQVNSWVPLTGASVSQSRAVPSSFGVANHGILDRTHKRCYVLGNLPHFSFWLSAWACVVRFRMTRRRRKTRKYHADQKDVTHQSLSRTTTISGRIIFVDEGRLKVMDKAKW